ncbi:MAG: S41 family peptidase [Balneolaceae bacterium]
MKSIYRPLSVVLMAVFLVLLLGFVRNGDLFFQIKKQLTIFSDVYKEVATQYVDEVSPETLMKHSIQAMLDSLDPYTVFIDEGEQQQMEILSSGSYGGIGIDADFSGNQIVIIAPLDGYPAQRAGLKPGDIIESINGVSTAGATPEEVHQLTIGDIGTTLELTVRRPGLEQSLNFELERERIEVKNITYSGRTGNNGEYGYIQLARFGQRTGEEMRSELLKLRNDRNLQGIILDLRNNPGGLLNEAVEVVDKFIEPGVTVVETRGRFEMQNNAFIADEPALFEDLPVVVLMNNGSASASEVVAGALQDLDRAVVIGENSFGKGLVQTVSPLSYNTSLKITVSKYYTPSGRSIQSVDYSNQRHENNSTVPDSLRRQFLTKNGRNVFDGNGIEPDIFHRGDDSSLLQVALLKNNEFFQFINQELAASETGEPENRDLPDRIFEQFVRYLLDNRFDYETPVNKHLEALRSNIKNFSNSNSAEKNLDELQALLRDHKISQIYENQEFIEKNLHLEWISQTKGLQERYEAMLEFDEQVQHAVELLGDSVQYHNILVP